MREGVRIKSVEDSNRDVKTLLGAKHVSVIKVVLFDRLNDVDIFLACESADFVAGVGEHEQNEQDTAYSTQLRRKCIRSFVYQ